MKEKCEYNPSVASNPRTKKQIQILLSRNAKGDKEFQNKSNSMDSPQDQCCQSFYFDDTGGTCEQLHVKECKSAEKNKTKFQSLDEKCGDKNRFEEIENKLEEMFAGIEDENLTSIPAEKEFNDNLVSFNKEVKSISELNNMDMFPCDKFTESVASSNKSSLPTKAAMKSTISFSKDASTKDKECKKKYRSFQDLRTVPMRRRLSIERGSDLFKFPIKNNEKTNCEFKKFGGGEAIEYNCGTSKKITSQKPKLTNVKDCNAPKYKIKTSNKKVCIDYTANKSNNKQKQVKNHAKKHKNKQGQRLLLSDNDEDLEEKTQQNREIDKNRSPFILVNNNGDVAVVNTSMQDEFNEKYTKTKISKSYVFERKTVKGCHSSTLSNRYDADKADSSWICVFCKKGPHKKGLGDLFGPYIISTDCDEYQSHREFYSTNGKASMPFFTEISSNKSTMYNQMVKHLCDDSIKSQKYNEMDMAKHAENHIFSNYSIGMKKISECSYEVWIHEDCAVWDPNIFIIGSRLAGLEEATWNSTSHECCYCSKPGAQLSCLQRDCKIMAHLPCAREFNWLLDESRFLTLCKQHFYAK